MRRAGFILFLAVCLLGSRIFAAGGTYFDASCINILNGENNTRVSLHFNPALLQIDPNSGNLMADLEVLITVRDEQQRRTVSQRQFRETIRHDFMQGENAFFRNYEFWLQPGTYRLIIEVRDRIAQETYNSEVNYDCKDLSRGYNLSDIVLIQEFAGASFTEPLLGENIPAQPDALVFNLEAYLPKAEPLTLRAVLFKKEGSKSERRADINRYQVQSFSSVFNRNRVLNPESNTLSISERIPLDGLDAGSYLLEVYLYNQDELLAEESRSFIIDWEGLRKVFMDIDASIEMMSYLVDEGRLQSLRESGDELKAEEFFRFWESRNPAGASNSMQALEAYYSRVFEADSRYNEPELAGWASDRGRVFILYGKPGREISFNWQEKNYLGWYYPKWNLRFVFFHENETFRQVYPKN